MSGYILSNETENNLIEIYCYGFIEHGKRQAEVYQQALKAKCQFLAVNPKLYRERKEFTPPVRIYPYESHLIVYMIEGDHIFIIRILHERMEVSDHLQN